MNETSKTIRLFFFQLFLSVINTSQIYPQGNNLWIPIGSDDFNQPSYGGAYTIDLEVTKKGELYLSYNDTLDYSQITVRKFTDKWTEVGRRTFGIGGSAKLELDQKDSLYCLFRDWENSSGGITVSKFSKNNWRTIGQSGFLSNYTNSFRLNFLSNGTPKLVSSTGSSCRLHYYLGYQWTAAPNNFIFYGNGTYGVDMETDSHNKSYIARINTYSTYSFDLQTDSFGILKTITPNSFISKQVSDFQIKLDTSNRLFLLIQFEIPYLDTLPNISKYFKLLILENGIWNDISPDSQLTEKFTTNPLLALNKTGKPYLAFFRKCQAVILAKYNNNWLQKADTINSIGTMGSFDLVVSETDTSYCAFTDRGNLGKITVLKNIGTKWIQLGESPMTKNMKIDQVSIVKDFLGLLTIAYFDPMSKKLHLKQKVNNAWVSIGDSLPINYTIKNTILRVGSDSSLYLGFLDSKVNDKITVLKYKNGTWQNPLGNGSSTHPVYSGFNMDITNDGSLFIWYINKSYNLIYEKYADTGWVQIPDTGIYKPQFNNLIATLTKEGIPYALQTNKSDCYKIEIKKNINNQWVIEDTLVRQWCPFAERYIKANNKFGVFVVFQDANNNYNGTVINIKNHIVSTVGNPGIPNTSQLFFRLEFDHLDNLFLISQDRSALLNGVVRQYKNYEWQVIGNTDFSADRIAANDIYFSKDDTVYAIYYSQGLYLKKYALKQSVNIPPTTNYLNEVENLDNSNFLYPNPTSNTIKVMHQNSNGSKYYIYNTQSLKVSEGIIDPSLNEIVVSDLPQGIYFVEIVSSPRFRSSFKFVKVD